MTLTPNCFSKASFTSGSIYSPQLYTFKVSLPYFAIASCGEFVLIPPFNPYRIPENTKAIHTPITPKTRLLIGLFFFFAFSRTTGKTFTINKVIVIIKTMMVDNELILGLIRLDIVHTSVDMFFTPFPVTK